MEHDIASEDLDGIADLLKSLIARTETRLIEVEQPLPGFAPDNGDKLTVKGHILFNPRNMTATPVNIPGRHVEPPVRTSTLAGFVAACIARIGKAGFKSTDEMKRPQFTVQVQRNLDIVLRSNVPNPLDGRLDVLVECQSPQHFDLADAVWVEWVDQIAFAQTLQQQFVPDAATSYHDLMLIMEKAIRVASRVETEGAMVSGIQQTVTLELEAAGKKSREVPISDPFMLSIPLLYPELEGAQPAIPFMLGAMGRDGLRFRLTCPQFREWAMSVRSNVRDTLDAIFISDDLKPIISI